MTDRRTIKSGLPIALGEELEGLVGALVPTGRARFRLERVLGRGSLYVTFRATRISEQGAVPHAVKVFRPSLARAWPAGARVLSREQQQVLTILNERVPPSPHVVRLLELGELTPDPARGVDESVPWLALDFIEPAPGAPGASLFDRARASIAESGVGLDPVSAEAILRGVALGLDWIHQHGLLHRALSPTNVLVAGLHDQSIAKISDVAIARPRGLPASFGVEVKTTAVLSDAPYRAPEQADEGAVLGPSCDVFALAMLARFALTGRGPDGPLVDAPTLHPTVKQARSALEALEDAIARCTAERPEARPATVHSAWWELLAPPLRELASSGDGFLGRVRLARSEPSTPPSWVWTERHRPPQSLALTSVAPDTEGHALAVDDGRLAYFDGTSWRPPPTSSLHHIRGVARLAPGAFLAFGRGPVSARASRIDAQGWLPVVDGEAEEFVSALVHEGMMLLVAKRSDHLSLVTAVSEHPLEGARAIHAIAPLDDRAVLVVGESTHGAPYVATFDARVSLLRPQSPPANGRLVCAAGAAGDAWVGGPHGTIVFARRVLESIARLRVAREQVPTHANVDAVAVAPDGTPWCAAGSALFRRTNGAQGGVWTSVFDEPSLGTLVAIAPRREGVIAFAANGIVIEGRAMSARVG